MTDKDAVANLILLAERHVDFLRGVKVNGTESEIRWQRARDALANAKERLKA